MYCIIETKALGSRKSVVTALIFLRRDWGSVRRTPDTCDWSGSGSEV